MFSRTLPSAAVFACVVSCGGAGVRARPPVAEARVERLSFTVSDPTARFDGSSLSVTARLDATADTPIAVELRATDGRVVAVDRGAVRTKIVHRRSTIGSPGSDVEVRSIDATLSAIPPGRYSIAIVSRGAVLASERLAVGRVPCVGEARMRAYADKGARVERGDRTTLAVLRLPRWEALDDTPAYRIEWIRGAAVVQADERRAMHEGLQKLHPGPASVGFPGCMWTFDDERYVLPEQVRSAPQEYRARIFREGHDGVVVRLDASLAVTIAPEPWPNDLGARLAAIPRDPSVEMRSFTSPPFLRALTRSPRVSELVAEPDSWTPETVYPTPTTGDMSVCTSRPRAVRVEPMGPGEGTDVIVIDRTCKPGDPTEIYRAPPKENPRARHDRLTREMAALVAEHGYPWRPEEQPSPTDIPR